MRFPPAGVVSVGVHSKLGWIMALRDGAVAADEALVG